jgi:nucleoid-associated protein YgaU
MNQQEGKQPGREPARESRVSSAVRDEKVSSPARDSKARLSSRLGKEAKIGLAVIGLLVVGLIWAAYVRITRPDTDEAPSPQLVHRDAGKHESPAPKDDPIFKGMKSKSGAGLQPTVVAAKPMASKPPKAPEGDWSLAFDKPDKAAKDKHEKSANVEPKRLDIHAADTNMSLPPAPPLGGRYRPMSSTAPPDRTNVPRLPPYGFKEPDRTSGHAAASGQDPFGGGGAGSYAPGGGSTTSALGGRETSGYKDRSTDLLPPVPPERPKYGTASVGQYGNNNAGLQDRAMNVGAIQPYRSGVRTYTVTEGDSLFAIARCELGKASRWVEIYELNRDVLGKDFNYLTPGMKLSLPDGEKPDKVARQPDNGWPK